MPIKERHGVRRVFTGISGTAPTEVIDGTSGTSGLLAITLIVAGNVDIEASLDNGASWAVLQTVTLTGSPFDTNIFVVPVVAPSMRLVGDGTTAATTIYFDVIRDI